MTESQVDILLVEDNPLDRELAIRALRMEDVLNPVAVARDGEEALDLLFGRGKYERRAPLSSLKVVLLDLTLPKVGGLEVLRAIRRDPRTRFTPVVIMTSSAEESDMIECYAAGANGYMQKPVDFACFRQSMKVASVYWLTINQSPSPSEATLGRTSAVPPLTEELPSALDGFNSKGAVAKAGFASTDKH